MTSSFSVSSKPAILPIDRPAAPVAARAAQSTTGGQLVSVANRDWNRYKDLAIEATKAGNYGQAEAMWLAALGEAKNFNMRDERLGYTLDNIASLYYTMGRHAQAELFCKKAVEVTTEAFGGYHAKVTNCLNNLAGMYYNQRRFADAEPICLRLITIYERNFGPDHADVGMVLNNLAMLYHAQGKLQAAEKMYQRAFAIRVKALGQYHPCVITLIDNYANLLRRLNRADDAERIGALARVGSRH